MARLELQLLRRADRRLAVHEREHLAPAGVDHGQRARRAGRDGVQGRDAGDRQVERKGQPARGREPEPQPGEAAGARADGEPAQVRLAGTGLAEQLVDALEHGNRPGHPLSQQGSVPHERGRPDARRGVKGESQHPRTGSRAGTFPGCRA